MTLLGRDDLWQALRDERLHITPLLDREQVGRGAIDLRLGTEFLMLRRTESAGLDPIVTKAGAQSQDLDAMHERIVVPFGEQFWLHPQHFVLAATLEFIGLADDCQVVQAYEGARSLAWERAMHSDKLSPELLERLEWGDEISQETYDDVRRRLAASHSRRALDDLFSGTDVLVTPAAVGEAPMGLQSTGDPRFCRLWTALGFPALTVPGRVGSSGLPIGIQLVARPFEDDRLIIAGKHLARLLAN